MKLNLVSRLPAFRTTCCRCGCTLDSTRDFVLADADGEPFRAYYCPPCAMAARGTEEVTP